jgi:Spy/CpxP family protein refolding chaperone
MNSKSVVFVLTVLCATAATAQTTGLGPAPAFEDTQAVSTAAAAQNMDRLATLLDLNEGQKAQVKAIFEEQRARMDELMQEAKASGQNPSTQQMQAMLAQVQKETHDQLSAVLTDSQLKKLAEVDKFALTTGPSTGLRLQAQSSSAVCDSLGRCKSR